MRASSLASSSRSEIERLCLTLSKFGRRSIGKWALASNRSTRANCVRYQDARDVKTKFAKTFATTFFPVDPEYLLCFRDWVEFLRKDQLFGPGDALFPKPLMGRMDGGFACIGLSRGIYGSAGKIREVIKTAFTDAGLPPFGPHSFRKTLGILANDFCKTPEQFKAWSMNLGHESIATTLSAYCPVSPTRQAELIRGMA